MEDKRQLVDFLKENLDILAWSTYVASGVVPEFICHYLNVDSKVTHKKQLPRHSSREHADVVKRTRYVRLSKQGQLKRFFTLNSWPTS